jgi:hypothetical protein
MPLVTAKLIEGGFTPEQKQEMIGKIIGALAEVESENLRRQLAFELEGGSLTANWHCHLYGGPAAQRGHR